MIHSLSHNIIRPTNYRSVFEIKKTIDSDRNHSQNQLILKF